MIDKLQKQFHSMLKALDVFYVLKGLKPVTRIIVNEDELNGRLEYLKKIGLKVAVSNFKIEHKTEYDKDFTNLGLRIDKNDFKRGGYFVYLSKNFESAEKSKKFEEENRHEELGISLGYPKCCAKFFAKNFQIESKKYNDYILASLANSKDYIFPYKNNFCIRNFDLALISHFPCNFNCKESIKIAEKNLVEISKDNNDIAKILDGMLKGAVIYSEDKGVFLLRGFKIEDNKVFYRTVMSSVNNKLSDDIKKAVFIEVLDKNKIKVKDKVLDGNYGFMLFE